MDRVIDSLSHYLRWVDMDEMTDDMESDYMLSH